MARADTYDIVAVAGDTPVPLTEIVGDPPLELETVTVPGYDWAAVGENVMENVQVDPAPSVLPQLLPLIE